MKLLGATLWAPLMAAFPDAERRDLLMIGGSFEGRDYVALMGHYCGTFRRDWLGIPETARPTFVPNGEMHEVRTGRIVQSNCPWEVLDVIRQTGYWPLPPSLGAEGMWPAPLTGDGLPSAPRDTDISHASIAHTLAMHDTLGAFDDLKGEGREGLLNMPQKDHWHPRMMWYGPAGIGATRGLQGVVDYHQLPFRRAFPRRKGGGQWDEISGQKAIHGGGHYIRVGDGPCSVTAGWPSVFAHHTRRGFLGTGPTNRDVTMRVMDFFQQHEGRIRENRVPLLVLGLLLHMGVNVLARMQIHQSQDA